LAALEMPLFLLPPDVYSRAVNGTPWSPGYSKDFFSVTSIDDSLWWCIALLRVHTRNQSFPYDTSKYLAASIYVWEAVLANAWDDVFGGGVWWTNDHSHGDSGKGYKNAITNELFLFASTSLYKATGNSTFLHWAHRELAWFLECGMINRQFLLNDGLDQYGHNNNGTTWSYNQGVILGGLVDMYNITGEAHYLSLAINISTAAIRALVDSDGVFSEVCDGGHPDAPPCVLNEDARIFKGIFVRYLGHLIPALHHFASAESGDAAARGSSGLSKDQARIAIENIREFVSFNMAYVLADPRNSATWSVCGDAPMPRPCPGAVWQSSREQVFAGYTSTLSTLDLSIVHAMLQHIHSST
jgi:predicted alpha-1,6-mannanase (GH76 family)